MLGTKTLYIGTDSESFNAADGQSFAIEALDVVRVSKDSNVAFSNDFSIGKLVVEIGDVSSIADGAAQVSITEGAVFDTLTLISAGDFSTEESNYMDLNSVFGDNTSVVLASMEDRNANLTVVDSADREWTTKDLSFGEDGSISFNLGAQVPEPSVYAPVFGFLALGFALSRRRVK